jgi:EAL domain-containing protein (putative c-di-GMP-specific phosphodiesterase class I)
MKVDEDREQQKIVSGILSLAERMGLETLAEGVETKGEHAMLAQLGCGHVQGFLFARPMAFEDTANWIIEHQSRRSSLPKIGSRTR